MDDNLPPNSASPTQPQAQPTNVSMEEQPLAPETPALHEVPKKGNKAVWALGFITVVVLLVVAYLAYQNYQLKQELRKTSVDLPTTPSTSGCEYKGETYASGESFKDDCNSCSCGSNGEVVCTTMGCLSDDPTTGWETYQSPAHGFSTSFPNHYETEESSWGTNLSNFQVVVNKTERDNFVIKVSSPTSQNDDTLHLDTELSGKRIVAGTSWNEFVLPEGYGGPGGTVGGVEPISVYAIKTVFGNRLYTIEFFDVTQTTEIQNQILSTFEFTE